MIDQSEAYQPLEQLTDLLIIGMFIISVMIIFVAFALARYLTDPILALAVAADRVRDGDLSARAPIGGGDETGRLAATFNSMVENVEKVDQMKSEFVLLASHQLRTPATAVKGFISMLLDGYSGKVDPKQRELMEAAYEENERQISVINSILDVARLEAGEMMLQRGLHDVGQVAAASAAALAPVAKSQHQTITVKRPRRPATILVDAEKLQLVLDNLIHNATKYSGPGTHISVEVKNHPHAVTVAVKDQGIGIDPADQARLFKRFSRIAGPQTANIQGAGLGLYLAGRLVKMHGGRIFVKSAEGKGTTFTVELPNITREDDPRGKNIDS
jgi:signal transduction histidine kinase